MDVDGFDIKLTAIEADIHDAAAIMATCGGTIDNAQAAAMISERVSWVEEMFAPVPTICPCCESSAWAVVGSSGIGKQVSAVRCDRCEFEWDEILMFRYRRVRRARTAHGRR